MDSSHKNHNLLTNERVNNGRIISYHSASQQQNVYTYIFFSKRAVDTVSNVK